MEHELYAVWCREDDDGDTHFALPEKYLDGFEPWEKAGHHFVAWVTATSVQDALKQITG